ncbi:3242c520-a058-46d6-92a0-e63e252e732f [Thermothielavioides terrestris]|uniref:RecQ-mediated genome instability protein 1 n=1 Tax=Thermothielavioides terrestris TaxID=2587410 RepID=A0A3S4B8K8_9PEZI|nr:3242c520-a058-46d6-92a0-e63e252e732f [Thermothielavioides terrestris]
MDLATQLQTSLSSTTTPVPSLPWLRALTNSTRHPPPPLASLLATARTRLLASDLTAPGLLDAGYAAAHALPADLARTHAVAREARLARDVVVQVLDIEDVARARWEQVEALEALARGEGTRGREIVRLPAAAAVGGEAFDNGGGGEGGDEEGVVTGGGGGSGSGRAGGSSSTHKLVVQDCKGQKVHAIELRRVERLAVGKTFIGEKILLRAGTVVARGVVLLDPAQCVVLGGKVDAWHRAWVDGRLARLREAVGADRRE